MQVLSPTVLSFSEPDIDLIPPQSGDAENAILGGILLDPSAIDRVEDLLGPDSFYFSQNKATYRAIQSLRLANKPVDLLSVSLWLEDHNLLEAAGGKQRLRQLVAETTGTVVIEHHAQVVDEKHCRRSLLAALAEMSQTVRASHIPIDEVLDRVESRLFSVTQRRDSESPSRMDDLLPQVFDDLERLGATGCQPGLTCGLYDLDGLTDGFGRGDLIIVAGRPSMGKTVLTTQFIRAASLIHGLPTLIFSMEMKAPTLIHRIISSEGSIDAKKLKTGNLSPDDWSKMSLVMSSLSSSGLTIHDGDHSVASMETKARRLMAEYGKPLGGIMIDYIQLMGKDDSNINRVQELSQITRSLKKLAVKLNVPVFLISQLSRACDSRKDRRPILSDLRESGALEQDADLVLGLYREEVYDKNTTERGIAEIIIMKQRNGPVGTVKTLCDLSHLRFRNLIKPVM